MEHLTGPILYVLIAWGIVTAIFMLLLIRRALLASHEDDQIFLDGAQEHMAREQREIVAKINATLPAAHDERYCFGSALAGSCRFVALQRTQERLAR